MPAVHLLAGNGPLLHRVVIINIIEVSVIIVIADILVVFVIVEFVGVNFVIAFERQFQGIDDLEELGAALFPGGCGLQFRDHPVKHFPDISIGVLVG
jgi:hypothetical protein